MHRFENWIDGSNLLSVTADGKMFATGSRSGVIQIGNVSGPGRHRLYGHEAPASAWFSGDGRQLASWGRDGIVRIWPVPDLSRPSLDAQPLAELLAKLDTMTNHKIVHDEESLNGWAEETGPFPGWAEVPEW
jgi:WD40 repeat protein